jgi:hypothetical protein
MSLGITINTILDKSDKTDRTMSCSEQRCIVQEQMIEESSLEIEEDRCREIDRFIT